MTDELHESPLFPGDLTAQLDQLKAGFTDLARFVKVTYDGYREAGFGRAEALQLTTAFQSDLMRWTFENISKSRQEDDAAPD